MLTRVSIYSHELNQSHLINSLYIGEQVDIIISKNQALQIYLKHHDNVYKTP